MLTADGLLLSNGATVDNDGQINYVKNSGAEVNTLGWGTYADAAGTAPVDGTGGSPTATYTRSTSSPLRGQGSFLLTKDAANRQGEGASYAFTIDSADLAKPLAIEFDWALVSGTFAGSVTPATPSDVTVWIVDVTNGTVTQPAASLLEPAIVGQGYRFKGTFQTASDSTSYRLCFHISTTSASAYVLKFDDISVGPQIVPNGAVVTDWTAYSPTISGFGTTTGVQFFWRRVGDSAEILGQFTAGTVAASQAQLGLPPGFSISSTIPTSYNAVGEFMRDTSGGTFAVIAVPGQTHVRIADGTSVGYLNGNAVLSSSGAGTFSASVPIQGWSSNVQASNDTDTRVVAAKAYLSGNTSPGSGGALGFDLAAYDTHGMFEGASFGFRIPVSGYYKVSGLMAATGASSAVQIKKNGSTITDGTSATYLTYATAGETNSGSSTLKLNAGDLISFTSDSATTYLATNTSVEIERVSGPAQIAASESINFRASGIGSAVSLTTSLSSNIVFSVKDWDSHNAYSAGSYTVPVSGKYSVNASIQLNNSANGIFVWVLKNASLVTVGSMPAGVTASNYVGQVVTVLNCIAGDVITVQAQTVTSTANTTTVVEGNVFEISRIGN